MTVRVGTANGAYGNFDTHFFAEQDEVGDDGVLRLANRYILKSNFPKFLPTWDRTQKYPPLVFHKYEDPALRADPQLPTFSHENVLISKITPRFGSEVRGLQLSSLDSAGKDELALLVAQRGVVVFRDQDFASKGPAYFEQYGSYFGKLHIHQTSGAPAGHPHLHVTFRRPDRKEFERVFRDHHSSIRFHSDVSYELQPPSYTFFTVLEGPDGGGDTLFSDATEAFNRLSPPLQDFLSKLHVLHSAIEQAQNAQEQGGVQRRKPVAHIHPLVRVHPVLKTKSFFVNRGFTRKIVELKQTESDLLLDFIYSIIENTHDLQLRARWEPGTITVWDNRRVNHSAIIDWEEPVSRHGVRITPQGERPVEDLKYLNDEGYYTSQAEVDYFTE
ncbi:AaceriACR293Cp [[Ashbya] aceris (nom. inval.)]|nr:AaceriACR293Cp [[Ashbya] aceris (nom. inval.)]